MMQDLHYEARQLIAFGESLSEKESAWLRAHLDECEHCRHYADAVSGLVRALHSMPVAADSRLVRATQMRVRFHASRLRETRERMWLVAIACIGVGLSAAFTAPLLWRLFAWMGERAGVANSVWQSGFFFFYLAPALVVSLLLVSRGTHLTNNGDRSGPAMRKQ